MSKSLQHIGIAGAGLLGRLLAWQLLRKGFNVSLFEAGSFDTPVAAAYTAAGMISPLSEAADSDPAVYRMGKVALELWPRWLQQLHEDTGTVIGYHQQGSLAVSHPQDHNELLQFHQHLLQTPGTQGEFTWLEEHELHRCEPDLTTNFKQALLLRNEAHIDNRKLLTALLSGIRQRHGICMEHCQTQVHPHQIIYGNQKQTFDLVIDCRGTGAKENWPQLRGVRGEVLTVQTAEVSLSRPVRLMHPRYKLYVVPKPDHCFVIGATQIESEDRSPVTLQSMLELSSALYTLHPAFSQANIIEQRVNLRPSLIDNLPQVKHSQGLISVNGLYRHGFLLAPAVVNHVLNDFDGVSSPFSAILKDR